MKENPSFQNLNNYLLTISLIVLSIAEREFVSFFITSKFNFLIVLSGLCFSLVILLFPLVIFQINIKKYFLFVFSFLILTNLIAYVHLLQYKTSVTMGAYAAIFETSSKEAFEFLSIFNIKQWLLVILLSALPLFGISLVMRDTYMERKKLFFIIIGFLLLAIVTRSVNNYINYNNFRVIRDFSFNPSYIYQDFKKIRYYFQEKIKLNNISIKREGFCYKTKKEITNEKQVFVLIIGESMTRNHLTIYGYQRQTTPKLETLDSLLVYTDVISPATRTTQSLTRVLTQATVNNKNPFYTKGSIITLAKCAGYNTYWISNQQKLGISDTETSVVAQDADSIVFLNTDWNTNSLDGKVLPKLEKILNASIKKQFIIIHLLGSHFSYSKRYPHKKEFVIKDNFKHYSYLSQSQINNYNFYDNSILYSDYIIYSIIKKVKKSNVVATVIYLSDHGEELYENKSAVVGHGRPTVTLPVVEIPFLVWNSKKYYQNKQRDFLYFKNTTKRPYSTDNLFFSIADILNINFEDQDLSKSVFSEKFVQKKRYIINVENKLINYESIKE